MKKSSKFDELGSLARRCRALLAALASLAALAGAPAARAQDLPRVAITVEAGALTRQQTPVSFALPAGLADAGPLELRDGRGRRLPLQVQERTGMFVLPGLARGRRARFEVVAAAPVKDSGRGVEVEQTEEALVVRVDGAVALHFRTRAPAPTPEVPARYTRAGYLHPVLTPSGQPVTDDSPPDHGHHHGIWTGWTVAELEGRRMSFWGPEPGRTRNDLVGLPAVWSGPQAGGFTAKLASSDLSVKPARQVLDSEWKVVVHRTHPTPGRKPPYFLFDLDWTDQVVGKTPLLLPEYRYGGIGVRGHRDWLDPTAFDFLTSEGADRLAGENTRARWVHLGGRVKRAGGGAGAAGLAVLVHPSNLRAPEPIRLNPGIPLLCVSPVKAGPLRIEPGRPYSARYRFVVSDGPPNRALLERLWRDYARAPIVRVEAPASAAR